MGVELVSSPKFQSIQRWERHFCLLLNAIQSASQRKDVASPVYFQPFIPQHWQYLSETGIRTFAEFQLQRRKQKKIQNILFEPICQIKQQEDRFCKLVRQQGCQIFHTCKLQKSKYKHLSLRYLQHPLG